MMKYGTAFLAGGTAILFLGFLLRSLSYTDALGRMPPYMGPGVTPPVLHAMRMWVFPYVLDTVSLIALAISLG